MTWPGSWAWRPIPWPAPTASLESAAIVETRGRFGTFISRFDPTDAAMAAAAKEYVGVARALGLTKSDAMRYLTHVPDD